MDRKYSQRLGPTAKLLYAFHSLVTELKKKPAAT
jgi:hypothetical protein